MATAGRKGQGGQSGNASPWARGMAVLLSAALVGVPMPAMSQVNELSDLLYQGDDFAARELPRRGFVLTHSAERQNAIHQFWWNTSGSYCVRVAVERGRVAEVKSSDDHDCKLRPGGSEGPGLSDLLYQGDDFARRELPRRGFVLTNSVSRSNAIHQFWWNTSRDYCVRVAVANGRVSEIKSSDDHDCNQRSSGSKGPSQATQVAIAAAAILGVAALAHKSYENNKERASQSPQDVAEFERGYRDGLYHQGYHNYNNRNDYSDGYQKGQEARSSETAYRSNQGYHSGNSAYVNVNDLVGARGSSADDALRTRGFVGKGGYQQGDRAFSMWWNGGTRQCLNMVVREGRVERLESIIENNCL